MKKISLFLSMVAFVGCFAISSASAQNAPKKAATTTQPAAKKACCAEGTKTADCPKGKTCPMKAKTAATANAPKAKTAAVAPKTK